MGNGAARAGNARTSRCTPSSRMLPSVIGGRRTYTTWIGELFMLSFAVKSPCICQPRWNVIRSSS